MGLGEWLTGRSSAEHDLATDRGLVDKFYEEVNRVCGNDGAVALARQNVCAAIQELNNVNGLNQYVGTVDAERYGSLFDSIAQAIVSLNDAVQAKVEEIYEYDDASFGEKAWATVTMAGAKFGEGVLSIAEDIGDGAISLVGWAAPKDSGLEKWAADFVEKDWSHDAFNWYYNSDLAKKSVFTEDSRLAGAFKIAGSTVGYLGLGGFASGAGGVIASRTAGATSKLGRVAHAAGTFMSSTTKVNTLTAGLSGMGSGTESGLHQGLSFDEAARSGAKQGAAQAGVAYLMGKHGEKKAQKAKDEAIGKAQQAFDDIQDEYYDLVDDVTSGKFIGSQETQEIVKKQAADIASRGQLAKDALESAQNIQIQGYNDAITKAGQKAGEKFATSVADNGLLKTVVVQPLAATGTKIVEAGKGLKNQVTTFKNAPDAYIQNAKEAVANKAGNVAAGAKNAFNSATKDISAAEGIKAKAGAVVSTAWHGVKNVAGATKSSLGSPTTWAALNATGREMVNIKGDKAQEQFKIAEDAKNRLNNSYRSEISSSDSTASGITDEPFTPQEGAPVTEQPVEDSTGGSSSGESSGRYNGGGGGYSSNYSTPTQQPVNITPPDNTQIGSNTPSEQPANPTPPSETPTTSTPPSETPTTSTPTAPTTPTTPNKPVTPTTPSTGTNPTPPTPSPSQPGGNQSTIVTPPSNNSSTQPPTQHTGGGYSGTGGYRPYTGSSSNQTDITDTVVPEEPSTIDDILKDSSTSIDSVVKGNKYTKIPTSSKPLTGASSSSGGGSTVIPIVAGVSAAAAAGLGAKAYMDRKKNNENSDDEDITTEEWSGDDTISLDYDDSSDTESYLDDDDEYGYQAEEETEKYDARNNQELADLQ